MRRKIISKQLSTAEISQRTCVGCRRRRPKRELVRLVCTPSGTVEIDLSAKKAGRGVYLCPSPDCWKMGLKKNRLDRALRTEISPEKWAQLAEFKFPP